MGRSIGQPPAGTDAVFRLRTSAGLTASRLVAGAGEADDTVINAPAVDEHTTFAVELAHDGPAAKGSSGGAAPLSAERLFIQSALLYTAADGGRRIRVLTRPLRVVRDAGQLIRSAHPPSLAAFHAKLACDTLLRSSSKAVVEKLQDE